MQHWIRPTHLPTGTAALDFTRDVLMQKFITAADEQALQRAELVVIHTDGSLINDKEAGILSMSFAVILNCRKREKPSANAQTMDSTEPDKILLSGGTMDGTFSSTNGELMAIAAALVVVPTTKRIKLFSDSRAAIVMAEQLLDKSDAQRTFEKSNLAYLASTVRQWFQDRTAPTELNWVKGHRGNIGNEAADRAAGEAHDDARIWSVRGSQAQNAPNIGYVSAMNWHH
ncbi:hypothetical protein GGI23_004179 [Coemansia sp. RSA 2559]|nr:hypothetical protein GGI23_004179 [Coemansia sp. RSA 2559]